MPHVFNPLSGIEFFLGRAREYPLEDIRFDRQAGQSAKLFCQFMGLVIAARAQMLRILGNGHNRVRLGQTLACLPQKFREQPCNMERSVKFESQDKVAQFAAVKAIKSDFVPWWRGLGAAGAKPLLETVFLAVLQSCDRGQSA